MKELLANSILAMAYTEKFTCDELFMGLTEKKTDGTFSVDIFRQYSLVDSFNVRAARYTENRYLVMELVDGDKKILNPIEVFDTLTRKKLTNTVNKKAKHKTAIQFLGEADIPRAIITSSEMNLNYAIINENTFDIINTDFTKIKINGSEAVNKRLYEFDGVLPNDPTMWRHIVMDRETGEILESERVGINIG